MSAANFFTIFLFARYFSAISFGTFMLAYTGLLFLTSVQNALIIRSHNVLAAALALPQYRRFTAALLLLQVVSAAAVCVALAAAGVLVAHFRSPATGSVIVALAVASVPWMGQEFVRRVLYTRGESRAAAINDMATYGAQLGGAWLLAVFWTDRASPEFALGVLGGSSLVGVLLGAWQLRGHVQFGRHGAETPVAETWREVWNFGKWLMAQNALASVGGQGHSWLIGIMLGAEQVGLYRAATHLVNVMNPLIQTCYSYLPSRASLAYETAGKSGLARWMGQTLAALAGALLPFCIVLLAFPAAVLHFAYGERYAGAGLALILALATVAQCLQFLSFPFDAALLALRETRTIFHVHMIPVVLLPVSGTALIYYFGIRGAPASNIVLGASLLTGVAIVCLRRLRRGESRRGQSGRAQTTTAI